MVAQDLCVTHRWIEKFFFKSAPQRIIKGSKIFLLFRKSSETKGLYIMAVARPGIIASFFREETALFQRLFLLFNVQAKTGKCQMSKAFHLE